MTWLVALGVGLAAGCDPDTGSNATATNDSSAATARTDRDTPVRDVVEQNANTQEIVERFGVDRVDSAFAPFARGGGPPERPAASVWPHQARRLVAEARCSAIGQCADVDVDACVTRETQRLAAWPGAACRPASVVTCVESIRTGGCAASWPLPEACAADVVCKEPGDVAR
jgi:hypothetical protein